MDSSSFILSTNGEYTQSSKERYKSAAEKLAGFTE